MLTRFAPSPTGRLHAGNIKTCLINWLFARASGGRFLLRIDDTDRARTKKEYEDHIITDLQILGIDYDLFARQSEHINYYNNAIEKLKNEGLLYPCYETPEELELKRKEQLSQGIAPIYHWTAEKNATHKENIKPHWRFKIDTEAKICWEDMVKGPMEFFAQNLADPILIRTDGTMTYMLPSVLDDIKFGTTHIIRGEDHVTNTAIQIQIAQTIDKENDIKFAHLPLMHHQGKISKRSGSVTIASLLEQGIEPMAINSYLATVGTSYNIEPHNNIDSLIQKFNIKKFSKSTALFDMEKLILLNKDLLRDLEFDQVKSKLSDMNIVDEKFWYAVRKNINIFEDVKKWRDICNGKIKPLIIDEELNKIAITLLPDGDVNDETWNIWIQSLKKQTEKKGVELFLPLRNALTGQNKGPELSKILPLIGREKILSRLRGEFS